MVRQRFDEIVRDQNNISNSLFKKYYKYPSPSIMNKVLNEQEVYKDMKFKQS